MAERIPVPQPAPHLVETQAGYSLTQQQREHAIESVGRRTFLATSIVAPGALLTVLGPQAERAKQQTRVEAHAEYGIRGPNNHLLQQAIRIIKPDDCFAGNIPKNKQAQGACEIIKSQKEIIDRRAEYARSETARINWQFYKELFSRSAAFFACAALLLRSGLYYQEEIDAQTGD